MEYGVNADDGRKLKGERHERWLGNDGKGAKIPFGKLLRGEASANTDDA